MNFVEQRICLYWESWNVILVAQKTLFKACEHSNMCVIVLLICRYDGQTGCKLCIQKVIR